LNGTSRLIATTKGLLQAGRLPTAKIFAEYAVIRVLGRGLTRFLLGGSGSLRAELLKNTAPWPDWMSHSQASVRAYADLLTRTERVIQALCHLREVDANTLVASYNTLIGADAPGSSHHPVRDGLMWVAGSNFHDACYIPPPPEYLDDLLADLCGFLNAAQEDDIAAAVIAYTQLLLIHPFSDGNGRLARAVGCALLSKATDPVFARLVFGFQVAYGKDLGDTVSQWAGNDTQAFVGYWPRAFSRAVDVCARLQRGLSALCSRVEGCVTGRDVRVRLVCCLLSHPLFHTDTWRKDLQLSTRALSRLRSRLVEHGLLQEDTLSGQSCVVCPDAMELWTGAANRLLAR